MIKNSRSSVRILIGLVILSLMLPAAFGAPQEAKKEAPKAVGTKEEAKWSKTTTDAATTPENKVVLAKGKPVTVTGEIVDASCYSQLGKKGAAHLDCGKQCIMNG